jgi:hypothetical protein
MIRVVVPGQNCVRMSEMVVAKSSRPSGNCRAMDVAPDERMRWMHLWISKL